MHKTNKFFGFYFGILTVLLTIISLITVVGCTSNSTATPSNMYQKNYAQALLIYNQMTLDERIGQLILPSYTFLNNSVESGSTNCSAALATNDSATIISACGLDQIGTYHIGAVLTGGGPYYDAPTASNWAQLNSLATQVHNANTPLDPLLLTGNDAVHINMHVQGGVMGPHNIGLGVTHDPQLLQAIESVAAQDSLYTGFNWMYAPTVANVQDLRWGRAYEGFGNDPALIKELAGPFISGVQNIQNNKITGALASAKHFIGDGATQYGFDESGDAYYGNQTDFWNINGAGYEAAVNVNAGNIMVSYNYINDPANTFCHFGCEWNILNQFKQNGVVGSDGQVYQFAGFAVSDWNAPMRSSWFATGVDVPLSQIMARTINAGVDMVMVSSDSYINPWNSNSGVNFANLAQVVNATKEAVVTGLISQDRLQDAVVRILAVKLAMQPQSASSINYTDVQARERELARQAAEESLLLLKNSTALLPVDKARIKNVVFVGDTNDIGLQNGGWSINWQGQESNTYFTGEDKISSGAATLEDGIRTALAAQDVTYYNIPESGVYTPLPSDLNNESTLAVFLVSEVPYAEMMGDIGNSNAPDGWYNFGQANLYNAYTPSVQSQFLGLTYSDNQVAALTQLKSMGISILTIVYSGRPLVISENENGTTYNAPLYNSDAVISAFLPGTTGGTAISNAIFGDYHFRANGFSNTLTQPWPANMQQVEDHFASGSLYPIGYGLAD
ncbi:MAG: glycoside hydrolase family 3 C-terminal domain-containing protein [Burkholderiales bacterium]|nr:glycoside hydrolase family 3 C-terminal domain-containing protein [Burkholderiales bacterium]